MTDSMIVDLFFQRDERAIQECDTKYGAALHRFANRITSDSTKSEECINDTYMKSWETIPPKEPRDHLFAYLSKILRNKCLDVLRKEGREKRGAAVTSLSSELTESAASSLSTDNELFREELSEIIKNFVLNLKDEAREIFLLRYFYMEDIISIAKKMNAGEGKVKTVLKRTRDKLKLYLKTFGYEVI